MSGAAANICGQLQRRLKPTGCIQQRRFTPVPVVYSDAAYELRGLQLVSRNSSDNLPQLASLR